MNGETVVQAGGSAEQQFEAAVQAAVPLELAPSELLPVDVAKLRAILSDVLTRADDLLSAKQAIAMESGFDMLSDLADEIGALSHNLAYALVGKHVLAAVYTALSNRARAVIEVCEMPQDLHNQYFFEAHNDMWSLLLEGCEVPERWRKRFLGEDIPY